MRGDEGHVVDLPLEFKKVIFGDESGDQRSDQRVEIEMRADCFAKKREERLFTYWPDLDGENEQSLVEDLVIRRNCVGPTPSRETTTRQLHNG
ncbi:hypothetical protein TNCV_407491 [Trichonephila clavipes]|nr:hypothetical protein TNCV_407491 [Trichonephila clavipes]